VPCLVIFVSGTPPAHAEMRGEYAQQPGNATGGRPAYFDASNKQWLYYYKPANSWSIGRTLDSGNCSAHVQDTSAQTPDTITFPWRVDVNGSWQSAPSVKATCGPPLLNAQVLVDNTNATASNVQGCGVGSAKPCRSIGYGVAQALEQAASDVPHTVLVQGGGAPYLGECGGHCNYSVHSSGCGIVIPLSASFAVVGLNTSRSGALVGAPVIDCADEGRAFTFADMGVVRAAVTVGAPASSAAVGGVGVPSQLVLEGLVVRNGTASAGGTFTCSDYECFGGAVWAGGALVLRRCAFESCSATYGGGAVFVKNAGLVAEDSCFTECKSGSSGGGVFVDFETTEPKTGTTIALEGCRFVNTTTSGSYGGGGLSVWFDSAATTNVTTSIAGSFFTGCSATAGNGNGGAVAVTHNAIATGSVSTVTGSNFSTNAANGNGGAMALSVPAGSTSVSLVVKHCNFVDNVANGSGGGGAVSVVLPEEVPQNLNFVGDPSSSYWHGSDINDPCSSCSSFPSCGGCPQFTYNPVVAREHEFRLWDHATPNNTFVLLSSRFVNNLATFSGGALAAPGGGAGRIKHCAFERNKARTLFGGGASLGGTVTLSVSSSNWRHNAAGQAGGQIYSSSGAGVNFTGGSGVELGCTGSSGGSDGSCIAGLSTVQSGNWTWDEASGMSCEAGYELVNSSSPAYTATLDSWQLKARVNAIVSDRGTNYSETTNCPCYFSTVDDGMHPLDVGFGSAAVVSPKVIISALTYACRPCASGQYSLTTPSLIDGGRAVSATCKPCPYGGSCNGAGNVSAAAGFWGSNSSGANVAPASLSFFRCPGGYCCDGGGITSATRCVGIDTCAGNRTGALCGGCAVGFTQTIGSTTCRATAQCGTADAVWFVPGILLLAALFALYALEAASCGGGSGWPLNGVQPALYFYQMAKLLPVGATAGGAMLALLASLSSMQLSVGGGDGFACPFTTLTALQAIELQYAVPALVLVALALGYSAEVREARKTELPPRERKNRAAVDAAAASDSSSVRRRYGGALVKVAALAYSTVLTTTFQLLHCVDLGGARVVFRAATHTCGAWQAPLYALVAALLLPVAVALVAAADVGVLSKLTLPSPLVARLRAPYREDCGHWEAVLALHRLCVVAVFSFGSGAVAAVLQTLVCGIALIVQTLWQPFRARSANRVQTALLAFLVVVALLNVPQAMLDTNARDESDEAKRLIRQMQNGEAVLLLAPALTLGAALLVLAWRRRRDVAGGVGGCCVALARCLCAPWACVTCASAAATAETPLDEELLSGQRSNSNSFSFGDDGDSGGGGGSGGGSNSSSSSSSTHTSLLG
jgi:uncharacterized membrane protein YgcG